MHREEEFGNQEIILVVINLYTYVTGKTPAKKSSLTDYLVMEI